MFVSRKSVSEVQTLSSMSYEGKILKKNREKIGLLYEKYYESIYGYCYRHISHKETAQDLTQDVFLRAFAAIDGYNDYGKFLNYLYVIARNLCTDYYRKKKAVVDDLLDGDVEEKGYVDSENALAVRNALDSLAETEREIVILRFYQELKLSDIAVVMGMKLSNVKYHLNKGMDQLERYLK